MEKRIAAVAGSSAGKRSRLALHNPLGPSPLPGLCPAIPSALRLPLARLILRPRENRHNRQFHALIDSPFLTRFTSPNGHPVFGADGRATRSPILTAVSLNLSKKLDILNRFVKIGVWRKWLHVFFTLASFLFRPRRFAQQSVGFFCCAVLTHCASWFRPADFWFADICMVLAAVRNWGDP